MRRFIIFAIVILFISCKHSTDNNIADDTNETKVSDSLRTILQEIHKKGLINGFGVAIVNQDGVVFSDGVGYANKEDGIKYTNQTVQNIGSVSKTFIGICLLKAQELGLLNLDDPVNNHLSYEVTHPRFPDVPITLRHLATHTSGIVDTEVYELKAYILQDDSAGQGVITGRTENFNPPSEDMPMQEFLKEVLTPNGAWYQENGFTNNKPGEIFEYTNVGATLAAATIEAASGKSFNEFCVEHVLKPLDMNSSGWSFSDIDIEKHSTLYANPDEPISFYKLITYPDGGMITSSEDFGKYLSELIKGYHGNGTLLSAESYAELYRVQLAAENHPDRDDDVYDDEYNTGIFMGMSAHNKVGHTGGDPGIAAYMFFDPSTNTGKLLMINTSISNQEGVDEFFDIWYTLDKYESRMEEY